MSDHVRWIWTWGAAEALRQLHWHLSRIENPPEWDSIIDMCGMLWRATGMRDSPEELVNQVLAYIDVL